MRQLDVRRQKQIERQRQIITKMVEFMEERGLIDEYNEWQAKK